MNPYQENFSSWADVQNAFEMKEPMPTQVLVAFYGYDYYDGTAYVAYRRGRKYYVVEGSHCSCHGLEGQWKPVEYTKGTFKVYLKRLMEQQPDHESIYNFENRHAADLLALV